MFKRILEFIVLSLINLSPFIIILKLLCTTLVALSKKLSEIANFPLKVPLVQKGSSNDNIWNEK